DPTFQKWEQVPQKRSLNNLRGSGRLLRRPSLCTYFFLSFYFVSLFRYIVQSSMENFQEPDWHYVRVISSGYYVADNFDHTPHIHESRSFESFEEAEEFVETQ